MKIIHIVLGKANPQRMNGVNKMVHELASAQFESGEQVEVWGLTKNLDSEVAKRSFKTRLFLQKRYPFNWDHSILKELRKEAGKIIVHFHGGFIPAFSRIASALRSAKIPYCLTGHGAYNALAMEKSKWKKRIYYGLIERPLLNGAQAVHCVGASELEALSILLPSASGILIPNGHVIPVRLTKASKAHSGVPVFGFCGRLRAHTKGLDIILEAFAMYRKRFAGQLLIIGNGEDLERLKEMAKKLDVLEDVEFAGAKYGIAKEEMLSQCDVFLHPSRNEGMPGAVLEAAGQGIPVIVSVATNLAGAVSEAKAGIALSRNDAKTLSQAMIRSIVARNLGELPKWANNAKNMVATTFSWRRIAGLFHEMYQS